MMIKNYYHSIAAGCIFLMVLILGCEPGSDFSSSKQPSFTEGMTENKRALELYKAARKKVDVRAFKEAMILYNKCIEIDPKFAAAYVNRSNIYNLNNQLNMALEEINKAIQIDKTFARAYFNRAVLYSDLKEYKKALYDNQMAIKLKPEYPRAFAHLGNIHQKLGQYKKALTYYNKAIESDFIELDIVYNRGIILNKMGMGDLGEADFVRATGIDRFNFRAFYKLAGLYSLQNDTKKTLSYLKRAKRVGFKDLELLKSDPDFKNFRMTEEYQKYIDSFK